MKGERTKIINRPCTHLRSRPRTRPGPVSSDRTALRHTKRLSYRCYLPVLTGFRSSSLRRIQSSTLLCSGRTRGAKTSGWEFDPAIADCGYRAPLSPHLARPDIHCYFTNKSRKIWWSRWGSNPRPPDCEPGALPTELLPLSGCNYGGESGIRTHGRG